MIGFDARTLGVPNPGGPARFGEEILKKLEIIEDNLIIFGHESIKSNYTATFDSAGFSWNSRLYGLVWEQTFLPYRARINDINVMFAPNSLLPIVWKGTKFVITIHDVASLKGYSSGGYRWYERLKHPIVARRADHIITVSKFSKREIIRKLNVPSTKISVVYNGVSDVFKDNVAGTEIELPERYVLYVGDTSKRKNIDGVVSSFIKFNASTDLNHRLVLIGPTDSPTVSNISFDEDSEILNMGYVTDRELKYAYENADLFLFPSRYEGFGISPLEAMSCGTPVIASDSGSLPEILGDAAVSVDPNNHKQIAETIEKVLTNEQLSNELVNRGYDQVTDFTWEDSAQQLQSVLYEIID